MRKTSEVLGTIALYSVVGAALVGAAVLQSKADKDIKAKMKSGVRLSWGERDRAAELVAEEIRSGKVFRW